MSRYDYEDKVLGSLKKRNGEATVGDVSADTGLPYNDVEVTMRRLLSLYKSHLDVDDDGNLRYRFDSSFIRRGDDRGRLWHDIRKAAWNGFKFFFKIWIMAMLVGYTIVFIVLLLALAIGAIAASRGEGDGDGLFFLPIRLLASLLEWMFWIDFFNDGSSRRRQRRSLKRKKQKVEQPFYQKVFNYVFGPEEKGDPLRAQQMLADFVMANNGRITAADWSAMTGQTLEESDVALTAAIVRFNGDVDVSEGGTLIYRFDELLVTAKSQNPHRRTQKPIWNRVVNKPTLTGNPGGTNGWITGFNVFIMMMSGLVLNATPQMLDPTILAESFHPGITIGLGWIPLVFSMVFFAVPLFRWIASAGKAAKAERENQRRRELRKVFDSVSGDRPKPVALTPKFANELVADYKGELKVQPDGQTYYFFDDLHGEVMDGRLARSAGNNRIVFGETIFSSDEETKAISDAEMEDFDRRLAAELEGSHVEFDFASAAATVGSKAR